LPRVAANTESSRKKSGKIWKYLLTNVDFVIAMR
jgi:hypothetical protein